MPGVQGLQPYQPGKPTDELERELGIRNSLKLASNENPLGPSPQAVAAMLGHMEQLHLYPDGNGFRLKQALAGQLGIQPAGITLGNGSNDARVVTPFFLSTPLLFILYRLRLLGLRCILPLLIPRSMTCPMVMTCRPFWIRSMIRPG